MLTATIANPTFNLTEKNLSFLVEEGYKETTITITAKDKNDIGKDNFSIVLNDRDAQVFARTLAKEILGDTEYGD